MECNKCQKLNPNHFKSPLCFTCATEIQLAACAERERERHLNARREHPVYKALRLRADQEYDDTPHVCPPSLPDDDDTPGEPGVVVCFEADLDAGIAVGRELASKGYAQLPDGYWMVTKDHMAKLVAQAEHLDKQILKVAAPGSWPALSTFEDSVKELKKLLPGGGDR